MMLPPVWLARAASSSTFESGPTAKLETVICFLTSFLTADVKALL